ncbi:PREDICTED: uncharacterized protein LOC104714796 isoform X2 [Camelina sativa]|uniref:Uncharacterized protein LOC104714796 isoform X2 n=1 Tax=Camelina sativa TaxID=90675 RepID=A0ABM0TSG4_CAMSA|nr:PREDICTED: uncharacterized protein LOC104714796 isoform X2 [Camelina sativa]
MEVKRRTLESPKMATKTEGEKITKKDDMIIKGHIKKGLRQAKKTTRDDQSPKISASSSSPSSSSYMMMKIKMGNYKNSIQRSENNTKKMEINHVKNKMVLMNPKHNTEEITDVDNKMMKNKKVWDCESTLYDSFELNSFNRQLDSAISSSARSMSMPHLSHSTPPPPPSETTTWSLTKKQQSPNKKISRSLGKLIKSMFRQKEESNATFKAGHGRGVDMDKYYVVFDKKGSLTTIPESGESTDMVGSEINSLVRKTTSERFPRSRLVGVSCY